MAQKYPDGVSYDKSGRPDFSPYVDPRSKVTFEPNKLTGDNKVDASAAAEQLRSKGMTDEDISKMEEGHTWHHVPGGTDMELVPTDLHDAYKHTGGAADIRAGNFFSKLASGGAAIVEGMFSHTTEAQANGTSTAVGLTKDALDMTEAGAARIPADVGAAGAAAVNQHVDNIWSGDPSRIDKSNPIEASGNLKAQLLADPTAVPKQ